MRVAVKIAYLGERYSGYQRQPGKKTVEGSILEALGESGLIRGISESRFASAGRTDRGVSALGQVIAFDLQEGEKALCRRINSKLPGDIVAWAKADVPESFHPRKSSISKTYLYLFDDADLDRGRLESACSIFVGTHDFSQFSRPCGRPTVRTVEQIWVEGEHPARVFLKGRGFLWMQVRKMMKAVEFIARETIDPSAVRKALQGERSLAIEPAPAENLILWDVEYRGVEFAPDGPSVARAKEFLAASMRRLRLAIEVRRAILDGLRMSED